MSQRKLKCDRSGRRVVALGHNPGAFIPQGKILPLRILLCRFFWHLVWFTQTFETSCSGGFRCKRSLPDTVVVALNNILLRRRRKMWIMCFPAHYCHRVVSCGSTVLLNVELLTHAMYDTRYRACLRWCSFLQELYAQPSPTTGFEGSDNYKRMKQYPLQAYTANES